jgi:mevalonate kinase
MSLWQSESSSAENSGRGTLLASPGTSGHACGKVILVGEHAAVDGHPAIALPLKSQSLMVRFGEALETLTGTDVEQQKTPAQQWNQCWSLSFEGTPQVLSEGERTRLTHTLELALCLLTKEEKSLSSFSPQGILIDSHLPLGAGMGGSAALSSALLRALAQALNLKLDAQQIAQLANELDGVFHGRASGLDAATVVADGIIRFQRGYGSRAFPNARGFWLLLIDTGQRTPTREMVSRVADLRVQEPKRVNECFAALADLASKCEESLSRGELAELGSVFNQAHAQLQRLDVSTALLDDCVSDLRAAGALGAKLTGGGGGGLAFGLFDSQPSLPLNQRWSRFGHFLTFVPADKNS